MWIILGLIRILRAPVTPLSTNSSKSVFELKIGHLNVSVNYEVRDTYYDTLVTKKSKIILNRHLPF